MNMIEALKEGMNKFLKTHKKSLKKKKKTVQYLKMEIESIKKIQTEGSLKMKSLGIQTRTTEASVTDRIQHTEESQALTI